MVEQTNKQEKELTIINENKQNKLTNGNKRDTLYIGKSTVRIMTENKESVEYVY